MGLLLVVEFFAFSVVPPALLDPPHSLPFPPPPSQQGEDAARSDTSDDPSVKQITEKTNSAVHRNHHANRNTMSGRTMPFQFHTRRPSAVVRQSGPGRSTLHLDLAAGGATTAAAGAAGGTGSSSRSRGAGGWRGRRGWWGSNRRVPDFLEFWGLATAAPDDEGSQRQRERRERRHHHRGPSRSFLRSPEFSIFVLGLAALVRVVVDRPPGCPFPCSLSSKLRVCAGLCGLASTALTSENRRQSQVRLQIANSFGRP